MRKKPSLKIEYLYILDCPWCLITKKLLKESLKELKIKSEIKDILIDTAAKAKKYKFVGSPTIRINGEDIQETIDKARCLPCEELSKNKQMTEFVKQECSCGCRIYYYKGKQYPYPPKRMIKDALRKYNK